MLNARVFASIRWCVCVCVCVWFDLIWCVVSSVWFGSFWHAGCLHACKSVSFVCVYLCRKRGAWWKNLLIQVRFRCWHTKQRKKKPTKENKRKVKRSTNEQKSIEYNSQCFLGSPFNVLNFVKWQIDLKINVCVCVSLAFPAVPETLAWFGSADFSYDSWNFTVQSLHHFGSFRYRSLFIRFYLFSLPCCSRFISPLFSSTVACYCHSLMVQMHVAKLQCWSVVSLHSISND